jgi:hypothetical protein
MMRSILTFTLLLASLIPATCQKSLILERANRAKTIQYFIGDNLRYRLAGKEDYWYDRTITDILPASNALLMDNFVVKLDSIAQINVPRQRAWRYIGGTIFTFGASLALATTFAKLYNDKNTNFGQLYGLAAGSMGVGYLMTTRRKLHLGKKHRLRIIEIKFPDPPEIAPPPVKQ